MPDVKLLQVDLYHLNIVYHDVGGSVIVQPYSQCYAWLVRVIYFRVTQVQRGLLESQVVQDFKGCQGREVFQDHPDQKEIL